MDASSARPLDRVVWRSVANRELREGHVIRNLEDQARLTVTNAEQFSGAPILIEYEQVIEISRFPVGFFRGD
jgi:hypothetical protein